MRDAADARDEDEKDGAGGGKGDPSTARPMTGVTTRPIQKKTRRRSKGKS
jgi:hypothetical protein